MLVQIPFAELIPALGYLHSITGGQKNGIVIFSDRTFVSLDSLLTLFYLAGVLLAYCQNMGLFFLDTLAAHNYNILEWSECMEN